ncbi:MAG: type II secretion system F family protein [Chloroflexi bacterium]|nr:type II secretion system F family protein [Chloroflexota bacterium]
MALEHALPATVFIAVLLFSVGLQRIRQEVRLLARRRLQAQGDESGGLRSADPILISATEAAPGAVERWLLGTGLGRRWAIDLMQADLSWRASEYLALRVAMAGALLAVGLLLTRNALTASLFAAAGLALPMLFVQRRRQQRFTKIADQLLDALSVLTNSLKVGHGLLQALEDVARDIPPPISSEIARVVREVRLGAAIEVALQRLATRCRSYDLDLVVTVMLIQRVTGGNLAEVLENIAHTIRERLRIQGEMRTLTAEGRLSGWILGSLPIFLVVAIQLVQPDYLSTLFQTHQGRLLLAASAVLEVVGFILIRRMVTVEV